MTLQHRFTTILSTLLVAGLCSATQLRAQQNNAAAPQQTPVTQPQAQPPADAQQPAQANQAPAAAQSPTGQPQTQQPAPSSGTSVNPSQAPLQPVTTYPDASGAQQDQQPSGVPQTAAPQTTVPDGPQPKKQSSEPVGAATAESVPTAGGAAAKPAGVAIAPAKQHQTRSLMLKVGAAVAAAAALGTVFALSHGTSSTPPGAGGAGVTQR